jgi:hypothetical protein
MRVSKGGDNRSDQRQENWRPRERLVENDGLDDELDRALARYAAVEPRSGLEERILANLRAQPQQARVCVGWRWPWAGAVAVVVLVLALSLSWRIGKPHLGKATDQRVTQNGRDAQSANSARQPHLPARALPSVNTAAAHRSRPSTATVRSGPQLEQFPSPQPLSEQEKILARYVATYPEHAALVAEARAEALRRDAVEEMRDPASEQKLQP